MVVSGRASQQRSVGRPSGPIGQRAGPIGGGAVGDGAGAGVAGVALRRRRGRGAASTGSTGSAADGSAVGSASAVGGRVGRRRHRRGRCIGRRRATVDERARRGRVDRSAGRRAAAAARHDQPDEPRDPRDERQGAPHQPRAPRSRGHGHLAGATAQGGRLRRGTHRRQRRRRRDHRGRVGGHDQLQRRRDLDHRGVAVGGSLGQTSGDDAIERGRQPRRQARRWRRRCRELRGDHLGQTGGRERRPPGDHLEQRAAERVDVGAVVDVGRAPALLGRHVRWRAHDRAGLGPRRGLGGQELGDPEVEDLHALAADDLGVGHQEHVLRLEVAMDDALGVRRGQRGGDLPRQAQRVAHRQRPAGQPRVERLAVQELHDQERAAVAVVAEVEHRDDAGVDDRGRGPRLVEEPHDDVRSVRQTRVQDLDRGRSPEQAVLAEVDRPHPALAELADDAMVAEDLAEHGRVVERGGGAGRTQPRPHLLDPCAYAWRRPPAQAAARRGRARPELRPSTAAERRSPTVQPIGRLGAHDDVEAGCEPRSVRAHRAGRATSCSACASRRATAPPRAPGHRRR
jgi:hypothetical protein